MHGQEETSKVPRITLQVIHILVVLFALWLYLGNGLQVVSGWFGKNWVPGNYTRRLILAGFSVIYFFRLFATLFIFLKRKMGWEEVSGVSTALLVFHIGFAFAGASSIAAICVYDYIGIALFIIGSYLNTVSELQRHFWKQNPENKGKLYTIGLFRLARHINYFGDTVWLTGFAILTYNWWSSIIPVLIALSFIFAHIPVITKHLRSKYTEQFEEYEKNTAKFIPFIY